VVGTVTVPVPVPSEPIGKAEVPVKVTSEPPLVVPKVTVNWASKASVPLSTANPATVTVKAPPGVIVLGESVIDLAVRLNAVSDTPTNPPLSVAVNTIVLLTSLPEVASSTGNLVA